MIQPSGSQALSAGFMEVSLTPDITLCQNIAIYTQHFFISDVQAGMYTIPYTYMKLQ